VAPSKPQEKSPGISTLQKENDKLVGDLASAAIKGERTKLSQVKKQLEENDKKLQQKVEQKDAKEQPQDTEELKKIRSKLLSAGVKMRQGQSSEYGKVVDKFMNVQKELNKRAAGGKRERVEVTAPQKPDSKYGKWADNQLRDQLSAARKLGAKDAEARIEKELKRRGAPTEKTKVRDAAKKVPEAKAVEAAQKKYADLMKKQQDLVNAGKVSEAMSMQRNVNAARLAWEKANAPALNAAKKKMREDAENAPKGMGAARTEDMRKLDDKVEKKTTAQIGDKDFDWKKSLTKDAELLAAGMYGTAIKDPGGVVVKRGELGQNEAKILEKASSLGLAPKMIAAELDGPGNYDSKNRMGRMAMELANGSPIGNRDGQEKAYWEARAALHRGGIAHNDMHTNNVFVDKKGKGQFVDMGLAQDSPKAALAEAMGVFVRAPAGAALSNKKTGGRTGDGDWQVRRWTNVGGEDFAAADRRGDERSVNYLMNRYPTAYRVYANKNKAIKKMKSFGLSNQDVADVMTHGIRSSETSLNQGAMGKLSDAQALQVINTLYDGF
jgi:hypothetical protein